MAARSSGKTKQASMRPKSASDSVAGRPTTGASAPAKTTRKTAPAGGKAAEKAPANSPENIAKKTSKRLSTANKQDAMQLLQERNEALLAELEQAKARIAHLEEVNKNVANRIDWVIDSLQSMASTKP